MAGEAVLIAAFSGRALAESARRAGFMPLVADAFADLDMRATAYTYRAVPDAMERGFRTKPLIAALDALVAEAPSSPIGIVLGSGLEDKPRLVEVLDKRYGLLGCPTGALRACKDPQIFFPVLDQLGIAHPETSMKPPAQPTDWISKRIGGSGGRHIRDCSTSPLAKPRRYFQRRIRGERISVSAVVANDGISTNLSRQWCAPWKRQPYRYGGAVSLPDDDTRFLPSMRAAVDQLARGLELRGLVSFDFVLDQSIAYLLEINPRPGATVDIFDDDEGTLFHAHVAACQGQSIEYRGSDRETSRAAIILHADKSDVRIGKLPWPDWAADHGAAGTRVSLGAPIATVFADAATPDAAVTLARARLAELESLIYESSKT